ncbi:MAG: hypothetical protein WD492_07375 [Alkalispirochaeta sp.]
MGKKKLCKWDTDRIRKKADTLRKQLRQPRFHCRKCARAARDQERLCKPESLD